MFIMACIEEGAIPYGLSLRSSRNIAGSPDTGAARLSGTSASTTEGNFQPIEVIASVVPVMNPRLVTMVAFSHWTSSMGQGSETSRIVTPSAPDIHREAGKNEHEAPIDSVPAGAADCPERIDKRQAGNQ